MAKFSRMTIKFNTNETISYLTEEIKTEGSAGDPEDYWEEFLNWYAGDDVDIHKIQSREKIETKVFDRAAISHVTFTFMEAEDNLPVIE